MVIDKNQAVINFLNSCQYIASNKVFFNAINAKDNNKQIITIANETTLNRRYIDGSVLKRYTFTIIDYKSVAYNALVQGFADENVEDMFDVQYIIDWITEQAEERNYPDFGDKAIIQDMQALTDNPNLNGIDSNVTPNLAKYSINIQIEYLDISKCIWQ